MNDNQPHFLVQDEGTIVLFHPITDEARAWWKENVAEGQSWGASYAVEHRFAAGIIEGIVAAGLSIESE